MSKTTLKTDLAEWDEERERLKGRLITVNTERWQNRLIGSSDGTSDNGLTETTDPEEDGSSDGRLRYVAGVDLSFVIGDEVNACAGYVILELPSLEAVYQDMSMIELTAPYVPGYLAFREADPLAKVISRQRADRPELTPQVLLIDGNGILHQHKFGLACHLGVILDVPTIGVAKNLYQMNDVGLLRDEEHKRKIGALAKAGDSFDLVGAGGEVLGSALKTCAKATKPMFVSVGHKIDLETAKKVTMLVSRHRVPEPTRQADIRSREAIRKYLEE